MSRYVSFQGEASCCSVRFGFNVRLCSSESWVLLVSDSQFDFCHKVSSDPIMLRSGMCRRVLAFW